MKSFFYAVREVVEVILIAVVIVVGIRHFLVQPFLVSGSSMEPNFQSGDYILINELSYRFREPERGEVIVFRYPGDRSTFFIKRILGLPNEKVVIKSGKVFVYNSSHPDGEPIKEEYLPPQLRTVGDKEMTLGSNEYFVMGDNRDFSFDSRQWGPLKKSDITGIAWIRLWPLNKVMAFEKPAY